MSAHARRATRIAAFAFVLFGTAAALAELEARRAACARMCNNAVALERGVRVIDHFLEQPLRL